MCVCVCQFFSPKKSSCIVSRVNLFMEDSRDKHAVEACWVLIMPSQTVKSLTVRVRAWAGVNLFLGLSFFMNKMEIMLPTCRFV